jgi:SAM-dependent MidA family methyltransferase
MNHSSALGQRPIAAEAGPLEQHLVDRIERAGGWLRFDEFMRAALYEPGLGYYAGAARKFGRQRGDGSDFVTAPELSGLFGQALARQVAQVLAVSAPNVLEFGAGSGRLAADLLIALGDACERYFVLELSSTLRETQQATLRRAAPQHLRKVQWLQAWPECFSGCAVGNEVLDAMPVRLIELGPGGWLERGVVTRDVSDAGSDHRSAVERGGRDVGSDDPRGGRSAVDRDGASDGASDGRSGGNSVGNGGGQRDGSRFAFATRPASEALRTLIHDRLPAPETLPRGYQTEIAEEAPAMVASLADVLGHGAALFIDYGFPQAEYYHPQRGGGTLMCHQGHLSDADPLDQVGRKDITAHVDFSAIALAGQDAGMDVLGYTSQARFLLNCGLLDLLQDSDWKTLASAQTLIVEHEMGELFKVLGFAKGIDLQRFDPIGFGAGDRTHTL